MPKGFYQTSQSCDDYKPAFLTGVLLGRDRYLAMTPQEAVALQVYPRWTLYIGPVPNRETARAWGEQLFIWAAQHGLVWLPLGEPCIVVSREIPWPYADVRWTWEYEWYTPRQVEKRWTGTRYAYFYQDGTPVV